MAAVYGDTLYRIRLRHTAQMHRYADALTSVGDGVLYMYVQHLVSFKIQCPQITQLNSTQLNEHLWMQVLKHLNVHIYLDTISYRYYNQLISRTDLSPIPVRSAAKSYITS